MPCANASNGSVCPQGVTWKSSTGTIGSVGNFTAPSSPGTGTVTATSITDTSKSGTAAITVVRAIPIAQTCLARAGDVNSLSCSLPSLAAGHTLVAVVRVHGSIYVRVGSFSDAVNGTWPAANLSSAVIRLLNWGSRRRRCLFHQHERERLTRKDHRPTLGWNLGRRVGRMGLSRNLFARRTSANAQYGNERCYAGAGTDESWRSCVCLERDVAMLPELA